MITIRILNKKCNKAEVAELVDAQDSKSCIRKNVWVQISPSAQQNNCFI